MTAAELKKHVELAGWETVADDLSAGIERRETFRAVLEEADEILTEMGWHTDRGLLQRIRAVLKS